MKLAAVVHRFGADIAGGSESHCRLVSEHLAERHDVTVLTTTASDHVTWRNAYPAGEVRVGRLTVRRFPVARQRSLHRFAEVSEAAFSGQASEREEREWFRENGPDVPGLLEYLAHHGREFDRVLFWTYRYATSFFGLPLVADRAVLVPTAEEDPAVRLDVLGPFFALPSGFVFLTPEEAELVARRAGRALQPSCIIGCGLDPPEPAPPVEALAPLAVGQPYVLYLGRIDPNKGCEVLVRDFLRFRTEAGAGVTLVLAGPANMPLPTDPALRTPGYVAADLRAALLSHAVALVVPSLYESLSMVLLEAWNRGVPALVNGGCRVLKGQVTRANGGLYYRSYDQFARGLAFLLEHAAERAALGRQGQAYVDREYRWPRVMATLESFLTSPSTTS